MYIMDDGIRLYAALELPEACAPRLPLVIVLHGFTGHMEEPHLVALSETIRGLGCATLRVELYGHGRSGGSFREHTIYKWVNNALRVIDYARSLDFVEGLYLCGHSQGGLTAMLAGAMKADALDGLILLSPATMIPDLARAGADLAGSSFDPRHVPERLSTWEGLTLDGNYARVAQTIWVEPAIDAYDGPVLLIQGTADETVPRACAEQTAGRYRNCELTWLPEDDHCYNFRLPLAQKALGDWLGRQLAASGRPRC